MKIKILLFSLLLPLYVLGHGSATTLEGSLRVNVFFVSGEYGEWGVNEKSEHLDLVRKNLLWLQGEGVKRSKSFTFTVVSGDMQPQKNDSYGHILEREATGAHYLNGMRYDNVVTIILVNSNGRAFSVSTYNSNDYMEHSVLYKYIHMFGDEYRELHRVESTITHEMLHLFGALDLYNYSEGHKMSDMELNRMYPDEIMRVIGYLSQLNISDFTAHLIGWGPDAPNFLRTRRILIYGDAGKDSGKW